MMEKLIYHVKYFFLFVLYHLKNKEVLQLKIRIKQPQSHNYHMVIQPLLVITFQEIYKPWSRTSIMLDLHLILHLLIIRNQLILHDHLDQVIYFQVSNLDKQHQFHVSVLLLK